MNTAIGAISKWKYLLNSTETVIVTEHLSLKPGTPTSPPPSSYPLPLPPSHIFSLLNYSWKKTLKLYVCVCNPEFCSILEIQVIFAKIVEIIYSHEVINSKLGAQTYKRKIQRFQIKKLTKKYLKTPIFKSLFFIFLI